MESDKKSCGKTNIVGTRRGGEGMSFTKIIYKALKSPKLTFNPLDLLNPNLDLRIFLSELSDGRYVDAIERHEMEKFNTLAKYINEHAELLPIVQTALNKEKNGEVRASLLQHRLLVHALFYNKTHILGELSRIIDELENNVKIQEELNKTMRRITGPQTNQYSISRK